MFRSTNVWTGTANIGWWQGWGWPSFSGAYHIEMCTDMRGVITQNVVQHTTMQHKILCPGSTTVHAGAGAGFGFVGGEIVVIARRNGSTLQNMHKMD